MRYAVLSDIHANLEALEAVLAHEACRSADALLVLGDLVGYGADPNAVVERVRALAPLAIVRGNHDKVAASLGTADDFNELARSAARWTADELTDDNLEYLKQLPIGPLEVSDLVEICHGSPTDEDAYIVSDRHAARAIKSATRPLCLFGHTHVAGVGRMSADHHFRVVGRGSKLSGPVALDADARYLVNPGSVGQPRDGDRRAAFAVLDTEAPSITLYRAAYPVEAAQAKILAAGLPSLLAHRLSIGQ